MKAIKTVEKVSMMMSRIDQMLAECPSMTAEEIEDVLIKEGYGSVIIHGWLLV